MTKNIYLISFMLLSCSYQNESYKTESIKLSDDKVITKEMTNNEDLQESETKQKFPIYYVYSKNDTIQTFIVHEIKSNKLRFSINLIKGKSKLLDINGIAKIKEFEFDGESIQRGSDLYFVDIYEYEQDSCKLKISIDSEEYLISKIENKGDCKSYGGLIKNSIMDIKE